MFLSANVSPSHLQQKAGDWKGCWWTWFYTFHVQSFNLLSKQVITYSCTPSIYCMIITSCIKFVVFIAFVFELFQPWLLCKIFFLNGIWLHLRAFCGGVVGLYLMQLTWYLLSSRPWMYAVMFLQQLHVSQVTITCGTVITCKNQFRYHTILGNKKLPFK